MRPDAYAARRIIGLLSLTQVCLPRLEVEINWSFVPNGSYAVSVFTDRKAQVNEVKNTFLEHERFGSLSKYGTQVQDMQVTKRTGRGTARWICNVYDPECVAQK
jgi:hypothetical protein